MNTQVDLTYEELLRHLKRLRMTGLQDCLDEVIKTAQEARLTATETLTLALRKEVDKREVSRQQIGMSVAHFPRVCTLEGFDFSAQPTLDQARIRELAKLEWIDKKQNLLFLGPPGVGKTHLAIALGRKAVETGYTVTFTTAHGLARQFEIAAEHDHLEEKMKQFLKPRLLIIDEVGYLNMKQGIANYFFELISGRYEKSSILLTSNCSLLEWGNIFHDASVTTAMLDRLLHHGEFVKMTGESYRLAQMKRSAALTRADVKETLVA